jgi:hypothetical protein
LVKWEKPQEPTKSENLNKTQIQRLIKLDYWVLIHEAKNWQIQTREKPRKCANPWNQTVTCKTKN